MSETTAETDARALLARLAADGPAIERICNTLQRSGYPAVDHGAIRRALRAAADECVTSPGSPPENGAER